MSQKTPPSTTRLLLGIMLGTAIALVALAVWMIATDQGSPVFVAVGGAMMAAFASIIASRSKKP